MSDTELRAGHLARRSPRPPSTPPRSPRHAPRRHQHRVQRAPGALAGRRDRPESRSCRIRAERSALRALPWNGVEPTLENLASGRYPLREVDLHWSTAPARATGVRRFLAFLASPRRQRALLRARRPPRRLPGGERLMRAPGIQRILTVTGGRSSRWPSSSCPSPPTSSSPTGTRRGAVQAEAEYARPCGGPVVAANPEMWRYEHVPAPGGRHAAPRRRRVSGAVVSRPWPEAVVEVAAPSSPHLARDPGRSSTRASPWRASR